MRVSFIGAFLNNGTNAIGRVRINSGNTALGAGVIDNGTTIDLVTMDDFIFGNEGLDRVLIGARRGA